MARRAEVTGEVGDVLLRFIANVVLFNQVVAQRLGLGASDSQFLSLLSVHGPMTPSQLVEATGLSSGTVSGVLDRLEEGRFILRERDTADRRRVVIRPDPQGLERTAAHYAHYGEQTRQILSRRTPAQLTVIADFLHDMVDAPTPPGQ